jgi:hypothetical protein
VDAETAGGEMFFFGLGPLLLLVLASDFLLATARTFWSCATGDEDFALLGDDAAGGGDAAGFRSLLLTLLCLGVSPATGELAVVVLPPGRRGGLAAVGVEAVAVRDVTMGVAVLTVSFGVVKPRWVGLTTSLLVAFLGIRQVMLETRSAVRIVSPLLLFPLLLFGSFLTGEVVLVFSLFLLSRRLEDRLRCR